MDPNRNNPNKGPQGDGKRPKGSIWIALIITVAIILIISTVFNAISRSQYTETSFSAAEVSSAPSSAVTSGTEMISVFVLFVNAAEVILQE